MRACMKCGTPSPGWRCANYPACMASDRDADERADKAKQTIHDVEVALSNLDPDDLRTRLSKRPGTWTPREAAWAAALGVRAS